MVTGSDGIVVLTYSCVGSAISRHVVGWWKMILRDVVLFIGVPIIFWNSGSVLCVRTDGVTLDVVTLVEVYCFV